MAYTKPQQMKKKESERVNEEGDQIKFIDLRFERWKVAGFRKGRRRQNVPKMYVNWGKNSSINFEKCI